MTSPDDDLAGVLGEGRAFAPGSVEAEINLGISVGQEPQAAFTDDTASGVVVTRSSSWWNHRRCTTCGHTFRRGDRVLVDSGAQTAQHLVPGLNCGIDPEAADAPAGSAVPGTPGTSDRDEFAAGLLKTWPPSVAISRIAPTDWRIPRPGSRRQPPTCLYCGHTFRPGEYVVICPCIAGTPDEPGKPACQTAVHRDPAAGLPCWERWQPDGTLTRCPVTLAQV